MSQSRIGSLLRCDVLNWLLPRRPALMFLSADLGSSSTMVEFTQKEVDMIKAVVTEGEQGTTFWATAHICSQLADWGASVSIFFHGCPLASHSDGCCKKCPWKGRMASKLAQGTWLDKFSNKLLNLPQGTAYPFLQKLDDSQRNCLLNSYNACKTAMAQRFMQVFSFWRELPWRLCALGICLFNDMDDLELQQQYAQSSKAFAHDAIEMWNHMQTNPGQVSSGNGHVSFHMARQFLDKSFPQSLVAYVIWWASSSRADLVMPHALAQALMKYCSALTVMQQLEAQHHFLHQKVSVGRASLPASTCAYLRRRTNKDLATPGLRDNLDRLLADLSKLVAIKWDSRTDSCMVFVISLCALS